MFAFEFDAPLRVDSKRAQARFERDVAGCSLGLNFKLATSPLRRLRELLASFTRRVPKGLSLRTIRIPALVAAGSSSFAVALMGYGYISYPPEFWKSRLAERALMPVFDAEHQFVGGVAARGGMTPDEQADFGYVPMSGAIPEVYGRAIQRLEDRNYGGWRAVCGIDVPATIWRWVASGGRAGGSGLVVQLGKQLSMDSGWVSARGIDAVIGKLIGMGAACRLYNTLGREGVMNAYASTQPVIQGGGTLRGIRAAAFTLFGISPDKLTDAQQLVIAAAAKMPMRMLGEGDLAISCQQVDPAGAGNAAFDVAVADAHPARRIQCRVLRRAKFTARETLPEPRLQVALADLAAYETHGIAAVDPFGGTVPSTALVNVTARTRALLPASTREAIAREARDTEPGTVLQVAFAGRDEVGFRTALTSKLGDIQNSTAGSKFCIALTASPSAATAHCGHDYGISADILAIKADVVSGLVKSEYANNPKLIDSKMRLGSLAKWAILTAAIADGYTPQSPVCPRSAHDNGRPLHRVTRPEIGFTNCDGGQHLISLEDTIRFSDNLAAYDLAKALGRDKLLAAAAALGLNTRLDGDIGYALALGTFAGTPREAVAATQALMSTAFGIPTTGMAPRVLMAGPSESPLATAVGRLLPKPEQRAALRVLLEAPVHGGTLEFLEGEVDAGKTATLQADIPDGSHRFASAKIAATFQLARREVNLFLVESPNPSIPLARHDIGANTLAPAHRVLLQGADNAKT